MKILVVCNAGMSSSILVKKIADYAASIHEEATVQAVSASAVADEKGKWDVCFIAPQIKYALEDVKAKLGIPTAAVEMRVYAMGDGKAAYEAAKALKG